MKKICVIFFCFYNSAKAQNITLVDELRQFLNIQNLPTFRTGTVVQQISTYDTTGGNNDGFHGNYSFLRKNTDGTLVIFDVKGAGVLNRIATPTPSRDTLDFYIDDSPLPFSICYIDLFSGKVFPFISPLCDHAAGGYYCYFPILFQRHLKIVCRGKTTQFHQLQYRLFAKGTKVKPFTPVLNDEEKLAIKKILINWGSLSETIHHNLYVKNEISLNAGEMKNIFRLNNGGRICGIEMDRTERIRIKMYWDGSSQPAIDCPVANFFAHGFDEAVITSLLIGSKNDKDYFYFPMPFDKKIRIEFVNESKEPNKISYTIYYNLRKRKPNEGKFYANYQVQVVPQNEKYVFLSLKGKGHYVGTILKATGFKAGLPEFFEGDDSTATDDVFRIHGTGSEDCFNGGWYDFKGRWDTARSMPLSGCLGYGRQPMAHTGGYRFYLNDKISFEKNIYESIEHGPTIEGIPAKYESVSFYYLNK